MLPIVSQRTYLKHLTRQKEVCSYLYEMETVVMIKEQYRVQLYP